MKYIVNSKKTVEQATIDLEASVIKHNFGVMHIYNLKDTFKKKGVDFNNECRILEVCNPMKAKEVLNTDMDLNMVLPCRISVYSKEGVTKIGMIKPVQMLETLSDSLSLKIVAEEVEKIITQIIHDAK